MRVFHLTLFYLIPYLSLAQADSTHRAILALPLDSVRVVKLNDLAWSLAMQAPDKAMTYAEEALSLAESIAYPAGQANAYFIIASTLLQTGHANDAFDTYTHSLKICRKHNLKIIECDVLRGMGLYFKAIGDIEMAKRYFIESATIAIENADGLREAKCYINLGALVNNQERLSYHYHAIQLLENLIEQNKNDLNIMNNQIVAYQCMSNNYAYTKLDSAFLYIQKAENVNKIANNKYYDLAIKAAIGNLYYENKNYDQAIIAGKQALALAKNLNIENMLNIKLNKMIALIYVEKKDYSMAIDYYSNAYTVAENFENNNEIIELNLKISELFLLIKQYDNAFKTAIKAVNLARMQEDFAQMANSELLIGQILVAQQKEIEAIQHFQECLSLINKNNLEKSNYLELYHELTEIYNHQKQPEKAAEMEKLYKELSAKLRE